jgi:hypothetical protein
MFFFNFTYPLRCLRVPQVEYHWSTRRYIPEDGTLHYHRCENLRLLCFVDQLIQSRETIKIQFIAPELDLHSQMWH